MIETYHLYSRHFGPQLFSSSFEFLAYNMSYFNKNVASKSNIQHISEYKALSIKQIQNFQNTKHLSNIINITHPEYFFVGDRATGSSCGTPSLEGVLALTISLDLDAAFACSSADPDSQHSSSSTPDKSVQAESHLKPQFPLDSL